MRHASAHMEAGQLFKLSFILVDIARSTGVG